MVALVSRIQVRPDGRWDVEVSVKPGRRVVTTVDQGPPPPELVEAIRRQVEERFSRPGPGGQPYAA